MKKVLKEESNKIKENESNPGSNSCFLDFFLTHGRRNKHDHALNGSFLARE